MDGVSDRHWDMTTHPVLDTIPSVGITKAEWAERVNRTGRPFTDPYVFRHSQSTDAVTLNDIQEGADNR